MGERIVRNSGEEFLVKDDSIVIWDTVKVSDKRGNTRTEYTHGNPQAATAKAIDEIKVDRFKK